MKEFENSSFWSRVNYLLRMKKKTLTELCKDRSISYNSVNGQRTRESLPKVEQLYAMSQYLGVSMEYLLTGVEPDFKLQEPLRTVVEHLQSNQEDLDAVCTLCRIKRGDWSLKGAQ